ncbi:asparagine synthase (glutamine-hydrolyzing) [Colwellia sp. Arc7-635]|uniref:asparagine synthase (glutamine-hydrolyzing) n=1 Tax=Colwellia sp. Arc7-635 TaxID=2497879 RepID=UPI0013DEA68B|nr:asparagine synthase (glutamine-hydrolyzing) [Colwellia sp. Arc7-635]
MCGINGVVSISDTICAKNFYKAHLKTAHRGPDDEGIFAISNDGSFMLKGDDTVSELNHLGHIRDINECELVLSHRRLSIIDLTVAGHQPFCMGKYVVVYNGEIYNYLELKVELEKLGVVFNTLTDTEVFVAAYVMWGSGAFKKFNGMWAAAIYDIESKKTVLTRDQFGIKPLYYSTENGTVHFSSEIKFIAELKELTEVDDQAVYQYLRYSETDYSEHTMFKQVKQVLPGQYIEIFNGDLNKFTFWDSRELSVSANKSNVEELLKSSIDIRLRSDVQIGSLLSGGIDSSLIVGLINESHGLNNFNSYSAVFKEEEFSEKKYIDKTADLLKFTPNFVYPKADDLSKYIEELIYIQELPFRSLSVLSQYLIYKEVAQTGDVKVLLNGQGADEIFSGYTEHYYTYFLDLLNRLKFIKLFHEFRAFKRYKNLSWKAAVSVSVKSILSLSFQRKDKYKLFNKSFKRDKPPKPFRSKLKNNFYKNLNFSALREYLRYEDKNSMHFSLESRLPFLDFRLVKRAFALNSDEYIQNGVTKIQLRDIGTKYLADEVRNRKDKTGFTSPQELWQKNEMKTELDACFKDIEKNGLFDFIDTSALILLYQEYTVDKHNDWAVIWRVYCLYKWKLMWLKPTEKA